MSTAYPYIRRTTTEKPIAQIVVCVVISVLTLACVAASIAARGPVSRALLITGSFLFIFNALAAGGLWSWYGRCIILGLIGCWIGDYLGSRNWEGCAMAFLTGHLAFCAGFAIRGIKWQWSLWALLALLVVDGIVLSWLLPHITDGSRTLVLAYVTVISMMVITAVGSHGAKRNWLIFAAGILFFISDIFVARWRFVGGSNFANALGCYPLYYSSCLLYGLSLLAEADPRTQLG